MWAAPASEHSHRIGGTILDGAINEPRSKPDSSGAIGVSAGPPGTTTFTVTPLPSNSLAWPADIASIPALGGP